MYCKVSSGDEIYYSPVLMVDSDMENQKKIKKLRVFRNFFI